MMKVLHVKDEIEQEVNKLWLQFPGIGVKDLMVRLEALDLDCKEDITKQRVKAAKQAVPYRRVEDVDNVSDSDYSASEKKDEKNDYDRVCLTDQQVVFVEQKIQERQSVRAEKRYKEADEITKGLTAMGIEIDDQYRTWKIGKKKLNDDDGSDLCRDAGGEANELSNLKNNGIPCSFCGRYFASKNLVFKHLRDVSTSCGNSIFSSGQKVPDAPSMVRRQKRKEAAQALRRKKTGKAMQYADVNASLWFGDLPIPYTRLGGQYRRLRALLRETLPRDVHPPWIKKVVRKAYRSVSGEGDNEGGEETTSTDVRMNRQGEYLGYAIIVFRDSEEANYVMDAVNGMHVKSDIILMNAQDNVDLPDFTMRVKKVKNEDESLSPSSQTTTQQNVQVAGIDPPLEDQLRPLSIDELKQRCERLRRQLVQKGSSTTNIEEEVEDSSDEEEVVKSEHDVLLRRAVQLYKANGPRREVHHKGRPVPESICQKLLDLLTNLRWPAANQRKGLTSERYLVLQTNVTNDRFYGDLREACRELMEWADPEYYYSGIAVTKNFIASPHIDDRDQSYQYAISLGDFTNGGQLCVEGWMSVNGGDKEDDGGEEEDYVNVVDTHNRIARVDGRHVHYVRSFEGGNRWSLIFYDTTDRNKTDVIKSGIDLS